MWTLYGLAEIGALTGNVVRRWHSRWISDERQDEENAETALLAQRMSALGVDAETFARHEPALLGNLQTLCRECEWPAAAVTISAAIRTTLPGRSIVPTRRCSTRSPSCAGLRPGRRAALRK